MPEADAEADAREESDARVRALACPASLKGVLRRGRGRGSTGGGLALARRGGATSCRSPTAGRGRADVLRVLGGDWHEAEVQRRVRAAAAAPVARRSPDGTAVVEAAEAIPLDPARLDLLAASSRGLGELIHAALEAAPARCSSVSAARRPWTAARACSRSSTGCRCRRRSPATSPRLLPDAAAPVRAAEGRDAEQTIARARAPARGAERARAVRGRCPAPGPRAGLGAALASLGAELRPGAELVLDDDRLRAERLRPRRHGRGHGRPHDRGRQGARARRPPLRRGGRPLRRLRRYRRRAGRGGRDGRPLG